MSTDLKKQNEKLKEELKFYKELLQNEEIDTVTGLYSKNIFFKKAKELLIKNTDKKFLFIKINIDKFQLVNAFYGFEEGDNLLKYFAHRLKGLLLINPASVLGYLGSDNFVLCCYALPNNGMLPLIQKEIETIIRSFRVDFKLSVSVGIYVIDDHLLDLTIIHSRTIVALKKSKEKYGVTFTIYDDTMNEKTYKDYFIINEMQAAFEQRQFEVYLQPKCNLSNGKIVGAEALVRWVHPERGIISPDVFIPTFESNGFVSKLDDYVWDVSCQYIRSWIDAGLEPLPISVNVSRVDLHNPDLSKILLEKIERNGIPIKCLHLEITETAYSTDTRKIINTVNDLHSLGFHIELDDFGTGYSSLNVLNTMYLDTLKLDMSFIRSQTENKQSGEIINFIVRLAKQLQLTVVAEGIETSEQLSFLRSIGCEMGQGYYFSRALAKNEFDDYMRNHTTSAEVIDNQDFRLLLDIDDIWFPNSKFNFIFNHFVGALVLYEMKDGVTSILRTNDEYFKVLNYTLEDVSKFRDDVTKSVHPEDLQAISKGIHTLQEVGNSSSIFLRAKTYKKNNGYMWLKMHGKVVAAERNSSIILASIENVDKEYKANEKLIKLAERRKELETQLNIYKTVGGDGVFIAKMGNPFTLVYANEEYLKIHEVSKSYAFKNKDTVLAELIHPGDRERIIKFITDCVTKKTTQFKIHLKGLTKTKREISLFARGSITYDKNGPILEVIAQEESNYCPLEL